MLTAEEQDTDERGEIDSGLGSSSSSEGASTGSASSFFSSFGFSFGSSFVGTSLCSFLSFMSCEEWREERQDRAAGLASVLDATCSNEDGRVSQEGGCIKVTGFRVAWSTVSSGIDTRERCALTPPPLPRRSALVLGESPLGRGGSEREETEDDMEAEERLGCTSEEEPENENPVEEERLEGADKERREADASNLSRR